MNFLQDALDLAHRGLHVFPLAQRSKHPLIKNPHEEGSEARVTCHGACGLDGHGLYDATTDDKKIIEWWTHHPNANIAIRTGACSGIDVLDVDGKEGRTTLDALEAKHGHLPPTLATVTGGGGLHFYFQHHPGLRCKNRWLHGIDIKAENGYVVAPPSIHESGMAYAWIPERPDICPWPSRLVVGLAQKPKVEIKAKIPNAPNGSTPYGQAALQGIFQDIAAVGEGTRDDQRNAACYRCGRLVAGGHMTAADAEEAMVAACVANKLADDLGEANLRKRICAGIRAGIAAGPKGPAPKPPYITVTSAGVGAELPHDEQATDVGNGKRLIRLFGENLRWCKPLGWLAFDGEKWVRDDMRVVSFAKESAKLMRVEAETLDADERKAARKHALGSEKSERIRAAISMSQSEAGVAVQHDALDADPWLLAVANGVIDLTTGKLRPHSRQDLITRAAHTKFDPQATCPRWVKFLTETFSDDQDLIAFIQKAFGYSLSGSNREQCLFLCHGVGSNGKSTLLGVMRGLLGDHATNADFSTFLLSNKAQNPGPRGDLARLAGVRLVTSAEPEGSARFSEGTLKSITGGDPITCAFKFQDEFTFTPRFKLWLAANHKPRIKGTDHAIWRRIRLIPFLNIIDESRMNHSLNEELTLEYPGILNWAINGGLVWQAEGLQPPPSVEGATKAYREEQDTLSEFISDHCHPIPGGFTTASAMYEAYVKWTGMSGDEPISKRLLGTMLCERGYERGRDENAARGYLGIQLKTRN